MAPVRTARRYAPRLSVTVSNAFPVASCRARTVTPGRTPPDASVIVPLTAASCACAVIGRGRIAEARVNRTSRPDLMRPPLQDDEWSNDRLRQPHLAGEVGDDTGRENVAGAILGAEGKGSQFKKPHRRRT